jgi:hypothetical protein
MITKGYAGKRKARILHIVNLAILCNSKDFFDNK